MFNLITKVNCKSVLLSLTPKTIKANLYKVHWLKIQLDILHNYWHNNIITNNIEMKIAVIATSIKINVYKNYNTKKEENILFF